MIVPEPPQAYLFFLVVVSPVDDGPGRPRLLPFSCCFQGFSAGAEILDAGIHGLVDPHAYCNGRTS